MKTRTWLIIVLCISFTVGCLSVKYKQTPNGAIWKDYIIKREKAPERYGTVVGWWQVAAIDQNEVPEDANIIFKYLKLIELRPDGQEVVVFEKQYDSPLAKNEYALFVRNPKWFASNDNSSFNGCYVNKNNLPVIDVTKAPERIIHGWTDRIPVNHDSRYMIEMKVKIKKVAFQLGSDYWIDLASDYNHWDEDCLTSNNCEAYVSGWYYDTRGKFKTIRFPDYNS